MKKIYIYTGKGKDLDGACYRELSELAEKCGGCVADPSEAEAVVALGGDGTMLHASLLAVKYDLPIIGVNLGLVGYMTELDRDEIYMLSRIFSGDYTLEERMTLSVEAPSGKVYPVLNDAVVHSAGIHMASIRLSCGNADVGLYRGDGLIFATPTGSTAYSMSAGGAVIDPHLKCICVTPICPQSLVAKPMVFSPDRELTVEILSSGCTLTPDGGESIMLEAGSVIKVRLNNTPVKLISLKDNEFFSVLRSKLDFFGKS